MLRKTHSPVESKPVLTHVSWAQVPVLQLGLKPVHFIFWMIPILTRLFNTQHLGL